jgi:hypothetical protein
MQIVGNPIPDSPRPMPPPSPGPVPDIKEPPSPDLPGETPHPNPDEYRDPPERTDTAHSFCEHPFS